MTEMTFNRSDLTEIIEHISSQRDELDKCDVKSWGKVLRELMEYCENKPLLRLVTEPLYNAEVGLSRFLEDQNRPRNLTEIPLPDSATERTAFIYQLLLRVCGRLEALGNVESLVSQDFYSNVVRGMHGKFVRPLFDELVTKLTTLRDHTDGRTLLPRDLVLFEEIMY